MDPEAVNPLDDLADRYDSAEQEETEARAEPDQKQTESRPTEGAENLAYMTLRAVEFGWSRVDPRLKYTENVYSEGREKLGPVLSKYGLGVSEDQLPNSEEIKAGFWLGALMKKTWLTAKALWENDKREREKQQNGDQREHPAEQSPYAIPGEIRPREESMPQAQSPYSPEGGEGGAMGPESGP
ncbi:hypothetical protein [Marinimicrobium agarilyticum]|uniref:hypothetical protein n=1 Tax=Marinimicrobium agarilyticum TaxID=306546 RepID=UPI0003FE1A69|nr:hypothetical protein [Marinimicrobium agarilyticum]